MDKGDFYIEIDYEKNSDNPQRIFQTMLDLISSFNIIDNMLITSLPIKVEQKLVLADIEAGSIRTWFVKFLEAIDDEGIKNLEWKKIVGGFLLRAKYLLIELLNKGEEIANRETLDKLARELTKIIDETPLAMLPQYAPVKREQLVASLGQINAAIGHLKKKDIAVLGSSYKREKITHNSYLTPEMEMELLEQETLITKANHLLRVKKPDMLGLSMWDFKMGNNAIHAKMLDEKWLQLYQSRDEVLLPGDSLKVLLETRTIFNKEKIVVGANYNVLKVYEVVPFVKGAKYQLPIFEE